MVAQAEAVAAAVQALRRAADAFAGEEGVDLCVDLRAGHARSQQPEADAPGLDHQREQLAFLVRGRGGEVGALALGGVAVHPRQHQGHMGACQQAVAR